MSVKRTIGLIALLAIPAALVLVGQAAAEPNDVQGLAFVTDVKGKVILTREGKNYLLEGMECLLPGDKIEVKGDADLGLAFCSESKRYTVKGEAAINLGSGGLDFTNGAVSGQSNIDGQLCPVFLASACESPKPRKELNADGTPVASNAGTASPDENKGVVTFRDPKSQTGACRAKLNEQGRIINVRPRPLFAWGPTTATGKYQVELKEMLTDDSGPMIKAKTDSPSFQYPSEQTPLLPGHCYSLIITSGLKPKKQIDFLVQKESELPDPSGNNAFPGAGPNSPEYAKKVMAGLYYEKNNYLFDAVREFSDAHALAPGDDLIEFQLDGLLQRLE